MDFKIKEYGIGSKFDSRDIDAITQLLQTADTLAFGPLRDKFERDFSAYVGVEHAVAVTSATAALNLAAQLIGLKEGDEVIGSPQTFRATFLGLAARGVIVRFADIDPDTLNMDPNTIEAHITPNTKAIFVVHYGGNPAEMEAISAIARKYHLLVVEDAAHALGAEYKGRKIGSIGDFTCFSFNSLKNMTTLGEGGMLTFHDSNYIEAAHYLRSMGLVGEYEVKERMFGPYKMMDRSIHDHSDGAFTKHWKRIDDWGTHYRLSEAQAAAGIVQLQKLDEMNEFRMEIAKRYTVGLSEISGIRTSFTAPYARNVWHLYPFFIDPETVNATKEEFILYLQNTKGIQINLRYFPAHLTDYMQYFGHDYGECPVCEKVWFEQQLNFPINPRMPLDDVDYIVESVREAVVHFTKSVKQ
jgi:perosamine synthetase